MAKRSNFPEVPSFKPQRLTDSYMNFVMTVLLFLAADYARHGMGAEAAPHVDALADLLYTRRKSRRRPRR